MFSQDWIIFIDQHIISPTFICLETLQYLWAKFLNWPYCFYLHTTNYMFDK